MVVQTRAVHLPQLPFPAEPLLNYFSQIYSAWTMDLKCSAWSDQLSHNCLAWSDPLFHNCSSCSIGINFRAWFMSRAQLLSLKCNNSLKCRYKYSLKVLFIPEYNQQRSQHFLQSGSCHSTLYSSVKISLICISWQFNTLYFCEIYKT